LQRAFIELEDGNWSKADNLLEQVLNSEPQNAKAYIGKLMVELEITAEEKLKTVKSPLETHRSYQRAISFADDA
jgi:thioredoxin-like negative regulator of GroEL